MKTTYKLIAIIAGIFTLASCSQELLDIPQLGVQSEAASYVTDSDCEAATPAVYRAWRHAWSGNGDSSTDGTTYCNLLWFKTLMSDDAIAAPHTCQQDISSLAISDANPWLAAIYEFLYKTIYAANIVLDKFPEDPANTVRTRNLAEAKFFRALSYYELITLWDRVPLIEHVMTAENNYQCAPATQDELWAFVVKDLTEAIESGALSHKKSKEDKDMGRITEEAAYAVRGKVYLTLKRFSDARDDFDKVIGSQLYGLIDNMADLYHTEANGCKEYIFENIRHWDNSNLYQQDGWYGLEDNWLFAFGIEAAADAPYKFVNFQGWGTVNPTKKLYDAFIAEEGASSPRRLASVLGMPDLPALKVSVNNTLNWTGNEGYFRFKWLMNMDDEWDQAWTGRLNNTPCMRYADVLLMMAEACVRDGKNADPYINEVRNRAGLGPLSGATIADVKKERYLELCFEATRWQDLKRWEEFEGDMHIELADKGKTIPTTYGNTDGTITVTYVDNPNPAAGWQPEDIRLPYPLVEIQTNKLITSGIDE